MSELTGQDFVVDSKLLTFIQAQARQAYFKSNHNLGLEIEDFVSLGLDILVKARNTYKPEFNTKFNTYFTTLLKRDLYKASVKTHRKKRGGAGVKEDDIRRGVGERWENIEESPKPTQHISITTIPSEEGSFIQIPAPVDNEAEYQILLTQVCKNLPVDLHCVFKQMTNPDPELLDIVVEKHKDKKRALLTDSIVADYLKLDKHTLKDKTKQIQNHIAKQLGIGVSSRGQICYGGTSRINTNKKAKLETVSF